MKNKSARLPKFKFIVKAHIEKKNVMRVLFHIYGEDIFRRSQDLYPNLSNFCDALEAPSYGFSAVPGLYVHTGAVVHSVGKEIQKFLVGAGTSGKE